MNPQEKAECLINEFYEANSGNGNSKQSVLVMVYETLKLDVLSIEGREYWNEVLLELNKL